MTRTYDFIGRRKRWYALSAALILVSLGSLFFKGLNLGIEFRGGSEYVVSSASCTVEQARDAAEAAGSGQAVVTSTSAGSVRVATESADQVGAASVVSALADVCSDGNEDAVSVQVVGPSWGSEITSKALIALAVFLAAVALFLIFYFEPLMAGAALIALAHDLLITVGIYSLTGLEVTPATVIGVLTILGYSLYDTVVVFDRVKEDTRGVLSGSAVSWEQAANRAVNETLARSINTTVVALLPVLAIIVVGAGLLGAGTLLDLSVALAVGMAAGAYSSIFVATPVLAEFKTRRKDVRAQAVRVAAKARKTSATAAEAAPVAQTQSSSSAPSAVSPRRQPRRKPRS